MVSTTLPRMFTTEERSAFVDEWNRLSAEPAPPDRRSIGCMTMLLAVIAAVGGPLLLPQDAKPLFAATLVLVFIAGALVWLFSRGRFGSDQARALQALEWLAANGERGDAGERRRHAVALLYYAYCVDGPSTSTTFNFDVARERLGTALPYVMEVERCLAIDCKIYRVFTDAKVRLPG